MPREIAFHGVYLPTVTVLFIVGLLVMWVVDRLFASIGLYRYTWHPSLFRLSLFACIYGVMALTVYR
jgi:hypothetical protein